MDFLRRLFQTDVIALLVIGIGSLLAAMFIRRMRLDTEEPSVLEHLLKWGGVLTVISSILVAVVYGTRTPDKPGPGDQAQQHSLKEYGDRAAGCSRPEKRLQDYKPGD